MDDSNATFHSTAANLAVFYLALASAVVASLPAVAQQVRPACTANSRDCMIAAATAYLDGLQNHDPSKVPLAADVRVTEQGHVLGQGANQVRDNIQKLAPLAGRTNTRFFVDVTTRNVIVYALLKIPVSEAAPGRRPITMPITDHVALRMKVEDGVIHEVEAVVFLESGTLDGTSNWPDAPP